MNSYFPSTISLESTILPVVNKILEIGRAPNKDHLSWKWHGKEYIGAVHGISGILYILLHIDQVRQNRKIMEEFEETCNWLLQLQSESGNFLSREKGSEYLVTYFTLALFIAND